MCQHPFAARNQAKTRMPSHNDTKNYARKRLARKNMRMDMISKELNRLSRATEYRSLG